MEYAALGLAVVALIVAFLAKGTASKLAARIEDAKSDAARRVENATQENEAKLALLRRMLAQMASGAKLTPDQILEERLYREIDSREGAQLVATGNVRIVDVRTPQETASGIIAGAQLIPIDQLEARMREIPKDGKPTILYCAGGGRSAAACEFLSQQGYENLMNLSGGFGSWSGPTAKPK